MNVVLIANPIAGGGAGSRAAERAAAALRIADDGRGGRKLREAGAQCVQGNGERRFEDA